MRGTQRLYNNLQSLEATTAPLNAADFSAPTISAIDVISSSTALTFNVTPKMIAVDGRRGGAVCGRERHLVVARRPIYNPKPASRAHLTPVGGPIVYFAQVADPSGNVALALDHGGFFQANTPSPAAPTFSAPAVVNEGSPFSL